MKTSSGKKSLSELLQNLLICESSEVCEQLDVLIGASRGKNGALSLRPMFFFVISQSLTTYPPAYTG